ncbi:MAG: SDR family oxidoreductase, partial [Gammaproteobacteria bacterium]|nr:SDR family oxidoreductase [Gammaproteobacteria bacterium]
SRSLDKLTDLPAQLNIEQSQFNDFFTGIEVDFARPEAISRLCDNLDNRHINITHLINNARSLEYLKTEPNGIVSAHNFTQEFVIDVVVPYQLGMALVERQGEHLKHIIHIGSQYGHVAANLKLYDQPQTESAIHYGVAKAALVHLTKEMAIRLAHRKIQVNCISYGGVKGRANDAFEQRYATLCPLGRMLIEEEIVAPIDMLINFPSISMTGHTFHADGGWSLW